MDYVNIMKLIREWDTLDDIEACNREDLLERYRILNSAYLDVINTNVLDKNMVDEGLRLIAKYTDISNVHHETIKITTLSNDDYTNAVYVLFCDDRDMWFVLARRSKTCKELLPFKTREAAEEFFEKAQLAYCYAP